MSSLTDLELLQLLLASVQRLNLAEHWGLPPQACRELAQAALPWARAAGLSADHPSAKLIYNYYWDGPLVEQLRGSDLDAQDSEAVRQWWNYTLAIARTRFPDHPNPAEDIAQESWIDTLRAVRERKYHFLSRFKTYLYSVVCHRGLTMLRWSRARPSLSLEDLGADHPDSLSPPDPAQDLAGRVNGDLYSLVAEAIDRYCRMRQQGQIPPQVKAQLSKLVLLEGESLQAAALRLGLNYDTAVTILRRLRFYLRQQPQLRDFNED